MNTYNIVALASLLLLRYRDDESATSMPTRPVEQVTGQTNGRSGV